MRSHLFLAPAALAAAAAVLVAAGCGSAPSTPQWDSQSNIPRRYQAPFTTRAIVVDGRLDDGGWTEAPWTVEFVDIEGAARPRPRFKTVARMAWDEDYFYIGARMVEPHLWATLTEHDAVIFQDNDFEVFLDPDGDAADYFEYEINALGTDWDLFLPVAYRDGGQADNSWEIPGLKKAVRLDGTLNDPSDLDRGWTVELAIPWSAFGDAAGMPLPPRPDDVWRVNFSRVQWKLDQTSSGYVKVPDTPEDNWVWSPQFQVDMHQPEHWGYVTFTR